MKQRTYIAIDLKSFYASVECRERGLDPLDTNLVVADESRTDKTICLAVTPSLKSYGISGRGRLFEVKQRVKEANAGRQHDAPGHRLDGTSHFFSELQADPSLAIDFIIAPPRMAYYMEYSTRIYQVYLKYIAPEDIVVYSIDEVFMDVTDYLNTYKLSAHDLAMKIILDVLETTGITATAGIGTNLFLCKVAMDIVAKHIPADKNGVRIAELDEMKFRRELWAHQPLTDFWRVGRGIAKKLEQNGMFTMGDVALCSERNEDLLYKLFGKNTELLIDHAWGWEPTTIEAIKAYRPSSNSLSSGQVLHCPYRLKLAFDFDSKQLAKVISAIADCGAQPELSIAFTVKNPARVSEELLINATENARAKAEILCKASGSTLVQLLNIDYNWGELNVYSRTSYEVEDCIQPLMAMSKCAAPEIEPDDIDVTDTVAFTWEIQ